MWADWTASGGISTSTPIQTCDNAASISVGDINGDGDDDEYEGENNVKYKKRNIYQYHHAEKHQNKPIYI